MSKEYTYDEAIALIHSKAMTGMEKACTMLEADTKELTHVRTGTLKRSWTHKVESKDGAIIGTVGTNVEYAAIEDWRHPNLSQAIADDQHQIVTVIQAELLDL